MNKQELELRTRQFAVNVFKLAGSFPQTQAAGVVMNQLLRCSSSVAANYRAALKAKSRRDFLYKLKIVLEEADESEFWLTFVAETNILQTIDPHLNRLRKEADELTAIFTASVKTISLENLKS
jgi:four helix bundle protein